MPEYTIIPRAIPIGGGKFSCGAFIQDTVNQRYVYKSWVESQGDPHNQSTIQMEWGFIPKNTSFRRLGYHQQLIDEVGPRTRGSSRLDGGAPYVKPDGTETDMSIAEAMRSTPTAYREHYSQFMGKTPLPAATVQALEAYVAQISAFTMPFPYPERPDLRATAKFKIFGLPYYLEIRADASKPGTRHIRFNGRDYYIEERQGGVDPRYAWSFTGDSPEAPQMDTFDTATLTPPVDAVTATRGFINYPFTSESVLPNMSRWTAYTRDYQDTRVRIHPSPAPLGAVRNSAVPYRAIRYQPENGLVIRGGYPPNVARQTIDANSNVAHWGVDQIDGAYSTGDNMYQSMAIVTGIPIYGIQSITDPVQGDFTTEYSGGSFIPQRDAEKNPVIIGYVVLLTFHAIQGGGRLTIGPPNPANQQRGRVLPNSPWPKTLKHPPGRPPMITDPPGNAFSIPAAGSLGGVENPYWMFDDAVVAYYDEPSDLRNGHFPFRTVLGLDGVPRSLRASNYTGIPVRSGIESNIVDGEEVGTRRYYYTDLNDMKYVYEKSNTPILFDEDDASLPTPRGNPLNIRQTQVPTQNMQTPVPDTNRVVVGRTFRPVVGNTVDDPTFDDIGSLVIGRSYNVFMGEVPAPQKQGDRVRIFPNGVNTEQHQSGSLSSLSIYGGDRAEYGTFTDSLGHFAFTWLAGDYINPLDDGSDPNPDLFTTYPLSMDIAQSAVRLAYLWRRYIGHEVVNSTGSKATLLGITVPEVLYTETSINGQRLPKSVQFFMRLSRNIFEARLGDTNNTYTTPPGMYILTNPNNVDTDGFRQAVGDPPPSLLPAVNVEKFKAKLTNIYYTPPMPTRRGLAVTQGNNVTVTSSDGEAGRQFITIQITGDIQPYLRVAYFGLGGAIYNVRAVQSIEGDDDNDGVKGWEVSGERVYYQTVS